MTCCNRGKRAFCLRDLRASSLETKNLRFNFSTSSPFSLLRRSVSHQSSRSDTLRGSKTCSAYRGRKCCGNGVEIYLGRIFVVAVCELHFLTLRLSGILWNFVSFCGSLWVFVVFGAFATLKQINRSTYKSPMAKIQPQASDNKASSCQPFSPKSCSVER